MRTRHGNISSQKRLQVAQMLREMRDHTEVVAVVVLPNCTPSVEWRREEGRRLLMRGLSEHKVTLGSRHLSLTAVFDAKALVMQSFSLTEEQLEELDPYVEAEEEKEPYEDYTYTVFNLVFQLPESDEEYFTRLSQMYSGFKIGMAPMRDAEEALDLIKSIYGRLYAARHISLDHAKVVEGLGCKALRVTDPEKIGDALVQAQAMARQHRVPVVVEVILEKVTNVAMGTEIDRINEFEAVDCRHPEGLQGLELAGLLE